MHDKSHSIIRLPVHLEFQQPVYFEEGYEHAAPQNLQQKATFLTAWFKLNENDPNARQYTYCEIPNHFVFDKRTNLWKLRIRGASKTIPRLYSVHPRDIERFHLRLLILQVKGPTSFQCIKTHNGVVHDTFKAAAESINLLDSDGEWQRCLAEAVEVRMPVKLREIFAVICVFNRPTSPIYLFNQFKMHLLEDFIAAGDIPTRLLNKASRRR